MKFLKKFATRAEYEAYMATNENYPFVGYIADRGKVEYSDNPIVEYAGLKGDGIAYITTDYYLNIYDQIEFKFTPSGGSQMIFGARMNMQCLFLYAESDWGYVAWENASTKQAYFDKSKPIKLGMFVGNDGACYSKNVSDYTKGETVITTYYTPPADKVSTYPLLIMACNSNDSTSVDSRIFKGTLHYLKITDSRTGAIKLDLVPVTFAGVAGLLDKVTRKFYGNYANNGSFSVVEE